MRGEGSRRTSPLTLPPFPTPPTHCIAPPPLPFPSSPAPPVTRAVPTQPLLHTATATTTGPSIPHFHPHNPSLPSADDITEATRILPRHSTLLSLPPSPIPFPLHPIAPPEMLRSPSPLLPLHVAQWFLLPLLLLLSSPLPLPSNAAAALNLTAVTLTVNLDRATFLIMDDVALAYQLVDPAFSFVASVGLDTASYVGVKGGSLDYGMTSSGLTDTEAIASPNLLMFPVLFSAIVPIYRLDVLMSTGVQLVLSRNNLALIYMGLITWWNDSRLAGDNAAVSMPRQRIGVVYHNESIDMNAVFTTALNKFNSNFTQYATMGAAPVFPVSSYASYQAVSGITAVAAAVVSTDGSIGYASQSLALQLDVNIAAMINKAGKAVQPSAQSVTFAAVELGTQTLSRTTAALDLTDGSGSSVWPICIPSSPTPHHPRTTDASTPILRSSARSLTSPPLPSCCRVSATS